MENPLNADLTLADAAKYPTMVAGMVADRVVDLEEGCLLYRFSQKKRSGPQRLASSWWWTNDGFEKIERYLAIDPGNAGEIARMQGGVKYEWSELDVLITAVLTRSIRAFQGPGKYQVERAKGCAPILFLPPPDLDQTYVPGIVDGATRLLNEHGRSAIGLLDQQDVPSFDDLGIRNLKAARGRAVYMLGNPRLH